MFLYEWVLIILVAIICIWGFCAIFIADEWVVSDEEFNKRINSKNIFKYDGCSGNLTTIHKLLTGEPPEFESCCDIHDQLYFKGGASDERLRADTELRSCVRDSGYPMMANIMYGLCRIFGHQIFPMSYRWGFGRPYRTPGIGANGVNPLGSPEILNKK